MSTVPVPAPDIASAVRLFHALSDETRLEIVTRLAAEGERCVCDLQDALDAGQSRLSFHLKVLKDAGLVADRREGRWSYYSLVPGAFEDTLDIVRSLKPRAAKARALKVVGNDGCCG